VAGASDNVGVLRGDGLGMGDIQREKSNIGSDVLKYF
jgi:hypothetical protein